MAVLPTFLGIGAPKAGTTWLANALDAHPEICFASVKEPDFFGYRFENNPIETYSELFEPTPATRAVGEFSTLYLSTEEVPERVASVLPDVRLVACLRNPVEQVYSHFWHLQRQNFHHWGGADYGSMSFEAALERFDDRLIQPALYAEHLERWQGYFSRERFHVELYDDVRADPGAVLGRVFAFVGVDPSFRPDAVGQQGSGERRGTSPRSARAARWGAHLYDTLNLRVYQPMKAVIGTDRASRLKDTLRVRQTLERIFRKEGYPPMAPETRAMLIERFREPNRRLADALGRDLSHWSG